MWMKLVLEINMCPLLPIQLAMERAGENVQNSHNPRNPGSSHFVPPSCSPAALPSHEYLVRGSEIQPPAVYHSLKPGHKGKFSLYLSFLWTISRLCLLY